MLKLTLISGSPRKDSLTHRVALHLEQQLRQWSVNTTIIRMAEIDAAPVHRVWEDPSQAPAPLQAAATAVFEADALLLLTPEYNGSYSPALKNFLDYFPKQSRKAMAIATASPGLLGGMRAAQQLLLLAPALFGIASPHLLIVPQVDKKFDVEGTLNDPSFAVPVQRFLEEFLWLANQLNKA